MIRNVSILSLLLVCCCVQESLAQVSLLQSSPIPSSRKLNRFGLEVDWVGQASLQRGKDKIQQIAIDERSVVMVSSYGLVTMFDAETGQKMWVTRIGRGNQAVFKPVMNSTEVLIVSGINLYALDRTRGGVEWNYRLPQVPSSGPAADDSQVYVGCLDGSVYAFDLKEIKNLFREGLLPEYSANARVWRYKSNKKITSPPIPYEGLVIFASRDESLYAVQARTRKLRYQFETDAPVSAPVRVFRDSLYLASEDFNFYSLNPVNGNLKWSFLSGLPIRKEPFVIDGYMRGTRTRVIYLLTEGGGMSALDAADGFPIWEEPQEQAVDFRAATQNYVFAVDSINNILILEKDFGNVIGRIPATTYNLDTSNARTDRLFLARKDGLIVMIRESDSRFPTYHKYPDRKPLSPLLHDPEQEEQTDEQTVPPENGEENEADGNGETAGPGEIN